MILVVVGADHVHAAGVDQGRDAALHAGPEDVLRSCGSTELLLGARGRLPEHMGHNPGPREEIKTTHPPPPHLLSIFISFCLTLKSLLNMDLNLKGSERYLGQEPTEETSWIPVIFLDWRNFDPTALFK